MSPSCLHGVRLAEGLGTNSGENKRTIGRPKVNSLIMNPLIINELMNGIN